MAEKETTSEEPKKTGILAGFSKVLEILANKVSKKAALIALSMVLTYLLVITPPLSTLLTINTLLIVIGVVNGIAVFGVVLQFVIDYINAEKREKRKEK